MKSNWICACQWEPQKPRHREVGTSQSQRVVFTGRHSSQYIAESDIVLLKRYSVLDHCYTTCWISCRRFVHVAAAWTHHYQRGPNLHAVSTAGDLCLLANLPANCSYADLIWETSWCCNEDTFFMKTIKEILQLVYCTSTYINQRILNYFFLLGTVKREHQITKNVGYLETADSSK